MKLQKTKKMLIMLGFLTFFTFLSIKNVDAKFLGRVETGTTDWADGKHAYRQTCSDFYVFWIKVSSGCKTETIV